MTQELNSPQDLRLSEVLAFFAERTGTVGCPTCGKAEFEVDFIKLATEPDRIFGAYYFAAGMPFAFAGSNKDRSVKGFPGHAGGRGVLLVTCTYCGFVRPHDYKTVWDACSLKREIGTQDA